MSGPNDGAVAVAPRLPAPARVGQATAVEQSRAVAEVEAAIVVAMRHPRDPAAAIRMMREACQQPRLAERAFFRFPRGRDINGKPVFVSGPSIHLARELARCWGNVQYGIAEMRRDDDAAQSEMLAFAWDVQTNTRNSSAFINPHMRDKSGGPERLTDMRDIYESNANAGARRVREAIFAILPTWFVEEAEDLCHKTLSEGGGKPLAQQVADAITGFANTGITQAQIEAKLGRPSAEWIEQDVAQLRVIYRSIQRGEVSQDEEFPPATAPVTAGEITAQRRAQPEQSSGDQNPPGPEHPAQGESEQPGAGQPAGPGAQAELIPPAASKGVSASDLAKLVGRLPLGTPKDADDFLSWQAGRPITTITNLTPAERALIAAYVDEKTRAAEGDLEVAVSAIWADYKAQQEAGGQAG